MTIFTAITVTAVCATIVALAAIVQRNKLAAEKAAERATLEKQLTEAEHALEDAVEAQPDNVIEHARLRAIVLGLRDKLSGLD